MEEVEEVDLLEVAEEPETKEGIPIPMQAHKGIPQESHGGWGSPPIPPPILLRRSGRETVMKTLWVT